MSRFVPFYLLFFVVDFQIFEEKGLLKWSFDDYKSDEKSAFVFMKRRRNQIISRQLFLLFPSCFVAVTTDYMTRWTKGHCSCHALRWITRYHIGDGLRVRKRHGSHIVLYVFKTVDCCHCGLRSVLCPSQSSRH